MARFRPEPPREVSPSEPAASNESNSATPTTPRARLPPTATHGDNRAPPQNDRIKPDFRSSWRSAASAIQSCWLLGSRWLPSSAAIANAWIWKKFCVSALALPDAFSHNPRPHGSSCRSLCGLDMHCRASRGARRADGEANSGHRPIRDPPAPLLAAPAEAATPNSRAPPQGDRHHARHELHWYLGRSRDATIWLLGRRASCRETHRRDSSAWCTSAPCGCRRRAARAEPTEAHGTAHAAGPGSCEMSQSPRRKPDVAATQRGTIHRRQATRKLAAEA